MGRLSIENLPYIQHMLHAKAYQGNSDPAGHPHENRLSPCLNQLDNIRMQPYGCHCHDNKELGQFLERSEHFHRHAYSRCNRRDDGCADKEQDEEREYLLDGYLSATLFFRFVSPEYRKR